MSKPADAFDSLGFKAGDHIVTRDGRIKSKIIAAYGTHIVTLDGEFHVTKIRKA